MEPLLPETQRGILAQKTMEATHLAGMLDGKIPSEKTREVLTTLLEKLNSYYSNLIEGSKTKLQDIDAAFVQDFSNDPKKKNLQLLAVAHIKIEREVKKWLSEGQSPYSVEFIQEIHRRFYEGLAEDQRIYEGTSGKLYQLIPGKLRDHIVVVGHHKSIPPEDLSKYLDRFFQFYKSDKIISTNRLISISAAHQRLVWIHPFPDGNGRASRLFTQACLIYHGYNASSVWSLSRAFAREKDKYYHSLHQADQPRRSDTDGRGFLSDAGLSEFCLFTLDQMIDQIGFMTKILDFDSVEKNYRRFAEDTPLLSDHAEAYGCIGSLLFRKGIIERSEVAQELACSHATATERIKRVLASGIASTPSEKGNLHLNFPENVVNKILPRLYDTTI